MKQTKKNYNYILVVITLIIGLFLGVIGSYYYFQKDKEPEKAEEKQVSKSKDELSAMEEFFITDLIERYDNYTISKSEIMQSLYSKDKTTVADLNSNYLRRLVARNIMERFAASRFTQETFQETKNKLFGPEFVLEDADIRGIADDKIAYDAKTKMYTYQEGSGAGGASNHALLRKIAKAELKEKELLVTVFAGIDNGNDNKVYKDAAVTEEVKGVTSSSFDIEKDYTKLSQFVYHFAYNEEYTNYYLTNIEKEK